MSVLPAALPLALAALVPCAPPAAAQAVGDDVRDLPITAEGYLHLLGEPPTMRHFEGRAVLLAFFSVAPDAKPAAANWPLLRKFHHEYAKKGLIVLALCDEPLDDVRTYAEMHDLPFLVGAGASCRAAWGVTGKFEQILVDAKGEVAWRGPTNGLWNGKLLEAVRGSKRPDVRDAFRFGVGREYPPELEKAGELWAEGKLAKGLRAFHAAGGRVPGPLMLELRGKLEAHVMGLVQQIDGEFRSGDAPRALETLETLVDDLEGSELARAPSRRLAEVEQDESIAREALAAKRFESAYAVYWKRGLEKTRSRFEKLIDEYPGTHAAQRARNLLAGR